MNTGLESPVNQQAGMPALHRFDYEDENEDEED